MTDRKILMTLMGMEIGGAETHVLELCKALTKRGYQVFVASNGGAYEPELSAYGIVHYKVPLYNRRFDNVIYAYHALKKIIRTHQIRLVHAHARIPGFLCGLLQKRLRFRFVTTAHGVYSTEFPINILTDWGEKSLVVSTDVRNYLMNSYRVPAENIRVTVNGIDTDTFKPGVTGDAVKSEFNLRGSQTVLSVSRLDADSATAARLLVEAAPALYRAYPDINICIIGNGTEYDAIKKAADAVNAATAEVDTRRGGRPLIIMPGGRKDAENWYGAADAFVGSGRSALEALSAGKPVVGVGNAGSLGLITEDKLSTAIHTNFMYRGCDASTAEGLAAGVLEALALPPETRVALGAMGRAVVQSHYSVDRMADDALAVYDAVVHSPWPAWSAGRYKSGVVISGYYGYNNSGDDLLLWSIVNSLKSYHKDLPITVLSMRPKETRQQYGVNAVYRFNLLSVYRQLRRTQMLITGAGSVIQDETSMQSLMYYLWLINAARRAGAKNMLYANGIGPVVKPGNIGRVSKTLNRVDMITLREGESMKILADMHVTTPEMHVTADAAFALPPADEAAARAYLAAQGVRGPFFCIAIRSWKNNPPGLEKQIALFADYVTEKYGYQALFVPLRPVEDTDISRRVLTQMQKPGLLLDPSFKDMDLIRGVTGLARFVLGMRLHALIYAMENGVPVVGLVYDPKIRRLMDAMQQRFYMPVETADADTLIRFADAVHADYAAITADIRAAGQSAREKAAQNIQLCAALLERP